MTPNSLQAVCAIRLGPRELSGLCSHVVTVLARPIALLIRVVLDTRGLSHRADLVCRASLDMSVRLTALILLDVVVSCNFHVRLKFNHGVEHPRDGAHNPSQLVRWEVVSFLLHLPQDRCRLLELVYAVLALEPAAQALAAIGIQIQARGEVSSRPVGSIL